jgi:hypothetical protein
MEKQMKHVYAYIVVLALLTAGFTTDTKVLHENKFTVQAGDNLVVEAPGADVIIKRGAETEAVIKVTGEESLKEKFEFVSEQSGRTVSLHIRKMSGQLTKFSWGSDGMKVEISLPAKFNTNIQTAGGDINISGIEGDSKLNTAGGDVHATQMKGNLNCNTAGGEIEIETVEGNVQCNTSGGDILATKIIGDVSASTAGGTIQLAVKNGIVKANSTGGDLELFYLGENKGIQLNSVGGDISLTLPTGIKANLRISSVGGDIECNVPTTKIKKSSSSKLEAELNNGGLEIKCNSTGGDVTIQN